MSTSLDDIDWLTRSENRVRVLDLLAEGPRDSAELLEQIGVSRVTFNRLLEALKDRGWIEGDRLEKTYEITPCGRLVAEDLDQLLETTDTAEKLSDIQQYLPTEEFDFDLRRFGGARITRPTKSDTQAPLRRSAELLTASTERMQMFVAAYDQLHAREVGELARRTPTVEGILTADVVEAVLADPTMREGAIEYIEAGVGMYHYNSEPR